jgi:hypothetical protein
MPDDLVSVLPGTVRGTVEGIDVAVRGYAVFLERIGSLVSIILLMERPSICI